MRMLVEARNGTVGVAGDVLVAPVGHFDLVVRIPDGDLRPGLINAHDHLHRNHYGRLGTPPYSNAYDWGRDIHARQADRIDLGRRMSRRDALLAGAWKNLRAGVTTVVHHDPWEPDFHAGFPLRVTRVRHAHSLGFERDAAAWSRGEGPFAVHLAEGVDEAAADEIRELDRRRLITRELLAVHAVGADDDGIRRLRSQGAAVVWCPTSNLFLFGATAPAALLAPGIDVLLGSDSLLSGAGDLLDELRCARSLALVSDDRLADAVGAVAARRLGLPTPSLEPGAAADFMVLRRPLLEATGADVALVVVRGQLRVVDPDVMPALAATMCAARRETMDGVARYVVDEWPPCEVLA